MTWEEGDYMITASGVHAFPMCPERTEIRIFDIAHALGRICRFGGHVSCDHYSVAQHSVLVSRIVPPSMALAGLLHDASEAYIGDIVRPFKLALYTLEATHEGCTVVNVQHISELERRWHWRIADTFGIPRTMPPEVKAADWTALWTERRDVTSQPAGAGAPLDVRIVPLSARLATAEFNARFQEIAR
jgi:hypothetical protein